MDIVQMKSLIPDNMIHITLNPLHVKFFTVNINMHKNVSTIYIIPPNWHDTGMSSWNPSSCKTRIYLFYIVNIMGADVLATQGAKASAPMILTMLNQNDSIPSC